VSADGKKWISEHPTPTKKTACLSAYPTDSNTFPFTV